MAASVILILNLGDNFSFDMVDHVPSNIPESSLPARQDILKDREAVMECNGISRRSQNHDEANSAKEKLRAHL